MDARKFNFRYAFPRRRPQFFATTGYSLARATFYYGFGRDLATPVRLAMAGVVRTPLLRSVLVLQHEFHLACGEERLVEILRRLDVADFDDIVVYQSQWVSEWFSAIVFVDGRVKQFLQVRPLGDAYPYPRSQPWAFRFPAVRGEVVVDDWQGRMFEPLPSLHRPFAWVDLVHPVIAEQASQILMEVIEPPQSLPHGWKPLHGDMTPWNLRVDRRGRVWLIDWDRAAWGPAAGDLLRFAITSESLVSDDSEEIAAQVRSRLQCAPESLREAAAFWLEDPIYSELADKIDSLTDGASYGRITDLQRGNVQRDTLRLLVS